jgi:hypothetical protein
MRARIAGLLLFGLAALPRPAEAQQPTFNAAAGLVSPGGMGAQFTATFDDHPRFYRAEARLVDASGVGTAMMGAGTAGLRLTSPASNTHVYVFVSAGVGGVFGGSSGVYAVGGGAGVSLDGDVMTLALEGRVDHIGGFASVNVVSALIAVRFGR